MLVFFDSEKVGFCFVVSNFLSPFPFEVFFSVHFLLSLRDGGEGGGDIPRQVSIPDLFCRFFEPSSGSPRFSPPPAEGGGTLFPPPPATPHGFLLCWF